MHHDRFPAEDGRNNKGKKKQTEENDQKYFIGLQIFREKNRDEPSR